jgi:uncharacterized membrane protein
MVTLLLDELSFFIFIACFILYFFLLYSGINKKTTSKFTVFNEIYKNWVKDRLEDQNPLVGVQALRNFIMGNSTFVSALFILLGIVVGYYTFFVTDNNNFFGIVGISIGLVQFTLLLFLIMFCLLNFILSIRYSSRLSLLISGKPSNYSLKNIDGINVTRDTLIHAQTHWMLGFRGLFYLIVSFSWLLHPLLLIISSISITIYLLRDHEII